MKDIIYKDYPVEDKDLASKKYVDSAVASNNQNILKRFEEIICESYFFRVLGFRRSLRYIGVQLADLQKKIEHK
nr:unnamed protein product [Callosobruchus analis]